MASNDNFFTQPVARSPPKPPRHTYSNLSSPSKENNNNHFSNNNSNNHSNMDLFNLSSADRVIKSLLDTVEIQSRQIKQLQIQQQSLAGQNLVKASVDDLTRQIFLLQEKVERIENEISVSPNNDNNNDNSNSIGPMCLANRRALAQISSLLSTKASTNTLELLIDSIRSDCLTRVEDVKKFAASSREQANLGEQIASIRRMLNNLNKELLEKVDRVDIERIESDAEYVKSHAGYLYEAEKSMGDMVEQVKQSKSDLSRLDNNIDSLNNHVTVLQEEMLHRVESRDFVSLSNAVGQLEKQTDLMASQRQIEEVTKILVRHDGQFDEVSLIFDSQKEREDKLFRDTYKTIEETSSSLLKQINGNVRKENFARIIAQQRQELGAKAWSTDLVGVDEKLGVLQEDYETTKFKADLSSR